MPPAGRRRRASPPPSRDGDGDASPRPDSADARFVRARVLAPADVAQAQRIFADGMRGLSPGVVRAGLLRSGDSWKAWLLAVAVGLLAAGWTFYSSPAPLPPSSSSPLPLHASLWLAAARSALVAAATFLAAYATYLSTIMEKYVRESLEGDMRDPWLHYRCGDALEREAGAGAAARAAAGANGKSKRDGDGDSGGANANHSCFWVAELVDPPAGALAERVAGKAGELGAREQQQPLPPRTLRRRLLGLVGVGAPRASADKTAAPAPAPAFASAPASASGPVIGCVGLEHKPGEDRAELRRMSVDQGARGRGAAVALAAALEAHAQARGLRAVFCTTSSLQPAAMALYGQRLGWEEVGAVQDARAATTGVTFHKYEKQFF